jgi:hypothetical protein
MRAGANSEQAARIARRGGDEQDKRTRGAHSRRGNTPDDAIVNAHLPKLDNGGRKTTGHLYSTRERENTQPASHTKGGATCACAFDALPSVIALGRAVTRCRRVHQWFAMALASLLPLVASVPRPLAGAAHQLACTGALRLWLRFTFSSDVGLSHLTAPQLRSRLASHGAKPDLPKMSWQKWPGWPPHSLGSLVAPGYEHQSSGFGQMLISSPADCSLLELC